MNAGTALQQATEIELTPLESAQAHDAMMRELDERISTTWADAGTIGLYMRNSKGWELLGFRSWNAWLMDAAPRSRSVVYAAVNALEELKDIPEKELRQMAHSTVHVLKKLPKELRSKPEVRESAKKLTTREFTRKMKRENPNLHLEEFIRREFRFTEGQEETLDKAIKKAQELYELPTEELCIEAICADFLLTENGVEKD